MKKIHSTSCNFTMKTLCPLLLAGIGFSGLTHAANITTPSGAGNAQLTLNNVGGTNLSATLVALDNGSLHGGQIFTLADTANANGAIDAQYSAADGSVSIPLIDQDAFVAYNATLLLTNPATWEFTVTHLTTTSTHNGSSTKVVFNQGLPGLKVSLVLQVLKAIEGKRGQKGIRGLLDPKVITVWPVLMVTLAQLVLKAIPVQQVRRVSLVQLDLKDQPVLFQIPLP